MKKYLLFIWLVTLASCKDGDENYPIEPAIKLLKTEFNEGTGTMKYDTLSITFSFTDGDGDIGLDSRIKAHTLAPFQFGFYYLKRTGERVSSDKISSGELALDDVIRFNDRKTPPYDTLPDTDYDCYYYGGDDFIENFPYCTRNENYYNIFVDFWYEDQNGAFVRFDWYNEYCITYNGRFQFEPGEHGPFILTMPNSKSGKLTYRITSAGFTSLFGDKKMKLRIYIKDRELHVSNVVETAPFYLRDI